MGLLNAPAGTAWTARIALAGSIGLHGAAFSALGAGALPSSTAPMRWASDTTLDVVLDDGHVVLQGTAPATSSPSCPPPLDAPSPPPPSPRAAPRSRGAAAASTKPDGSPAGTPLPAPALATAEDEPALPVPSSDAPAAATTPAAPETSHDRLAARPAETGDSATAAGDRDASMAGYARLVQSRLSRAAASPEIAALVDRRANILLEIVIDPDGAVRSARIVDGPAEPTLRNAALRVERIAEPFPPLPQEMRGDGPIAFRLPLRFTVRPR